MLNMRKHIMAYIGACLGDAFEPLVQMDFTQMNARCISTNTSHIHAIFMHHIVAYDCVLTCRHCSFLIGPAPESAPEYLFEEQCPPVDLPSKQTPLFIPIQSYPLTPALFYRIRKTMIQLLLYAAVVEPIPLHDLSLPQ